MRRRRSLLKACPKPKRKRDSDYLDWIKSLNCIVCRATPCDAHHIQPKGQGSMAGKCDDDRALPLCRRHHNEYHSRGRDTFATKYTLDYETLISAYQTLWRLLCGKKT
jgi:hypothetical protein